MPPIPHGWGSSQDSVGLAVEYAKALGCGKVNCLAGIPPEGADPGELRATFVANLRFAAAELGGAGIRLLVEPINTRDIPGFYLNYSKQALSIIEEVGSDNLSATVRRVPHADHGGRPDADYAGERGQHRSHPDSGHAGAARAGHGGDQLRARLLSHRRYGVRGLGSGASIFR